jgi:catechol 1,2-dioxygenase
MAVETQGLRRRGLEKTSVPGHKSGPAVSLENPNSKYPLPPFPEQHAMLGQQIRRTGDELCANLPILDSATIGPGAMFMDRSSNQRSLLDSVLDSFEATPDARLREIIKSLVEHLHHLVAEVRLSHEEWQKGIEFLTAVGKKCTPERQEFMLLSDVLGISSAVDVANDMHPEATPGTVLGPYYMSDSPQRANGASLIDTDDGGSHLRVHGLISDVSGNPIPEARVDVWSCASNGLYPAQDPAQAPTNLRGVIAADLQGRFEFAVLRPHNYSIPMDGPVGELMRSTLRSPMRAAHVHMIVSAAGYHGVTTHLFDGECKYLSADSVFSTREQLVRRFSKDSAGELTVTFNVRLMALDPPKSQVPLPRQ